MKEEPSTRIAILASSIPDPSAESSGGPREQIATLANALRAEVIGPSQAGNGSLFGSWLSRLVGTDPFLVMGAFRRRNEFDVVLSMEERLGIFLGVFLRLARTGPRQVMVVHRITATWKRRVVALFRLHRSIDAFLVYADSQRRALLERWSVPSDRVIRLWGYADTDFLRPSEPRRNGRGEEPFVLAVGVESRDYETLVAAVRDLNVRVLIKASSPWATGSPVPDVDALPSNVTVRSELIDDRDLRALYSSSDIFVMPLVENDYAAGITAVSEAMAMALPVVCTQVVGIRDVVADGDTGLRVPPGDSDGLRSAIAWLVGHPSAAISMGAAGRSRAVEVASPEAFVARVCRAVDAALTRTG